MKLRFKVKSDEVGRISIVTIGCLALIFAFALPGFGQSNAQQESTPVAKAGRQKEKNTGPGREMSQGGKDIGKGAAKGSVDLGKGVVGGAGNLVTGHPIDAGVSVGKGAAGFGKNAGLGTVKGAYKIGKGMGGELKKLGGKSKDKSESSD